MSVVKKAADEHCGRDAGQQGWIRPRRRCGTAKYDMWDGVDGEMGCKDGDGLGKYQHGTNTNLMEYRCSRIMGVAENIRCKDSSG